MEYDPKNKFQVRLRNVSDTSLYLPRSLVLEAVDFECSAIGFVSAISKIENNLETSKKKAWDVSKEYESRVLRMLDKFEDLIATTNSDFGSTGLVKHSIRTKGHPPIRQRPNRTSRQAK